MTSIDGSGRIVFNGIDENGLKVFSGKFNEFGHFVKGGRSFKVTLTEALHIVDSIRKTGTKYLTEEVDILAGLFRYKFTHYCSETKHIVSSLGPRALNRTLRENLHIVPNTYTKFTRNMVERVLLNISSTKKLTRALIEQVHIADIIWARRVYILIEHLHIADSMNKKVTKTLVEPVIININRFVKATRTLIENVIIDALYNPRRLLILMENIHISDAIERSVIKTLIERVKLTINVEGLGGFVMKLMSTKTKEIYKGSTIYTNKLLSDVKSLYNTTQTKVIPVKSEVTPTREHTNVGLEDGRDLR